MEGEDAEAFRQMADAHLAVFRPRNDVELEFATTFTLAAWRRRRCVSTEASMVNQYIRDTPLDEKLREEEDVLATGAQLFFDSQGSGSSFPTRRTRTGPDPSARRFPAVWTRPRGWSTSWNRPIRAAAGCWRNGTSCAGEPEGQFLERASTSSRPSGCSASSRSRCLKTRRAICS